jgi:sugar lactone lactonase YvrE
MEYNVTQNITTIAQPYSCSVDDRGDVFTTDLATGDIYRRDADGTMTAITAAAISLNGSCAVNPAGTVVYFKDSGTNQVYALQLTGSNPKLAGSWTKTTLTSGGQGYVDGAGTVAKFNFASDVGIALDLSGSLYVTDGLNNRIRRIDRIAGQ